MKQTAVEWLIETHFGSIENCTPDFRNKIKQADKMFEQQIIEAHGNQTKKSGGISNYTYILTGEQYYKETFKQD
jgi:hypothetical protein